MRSLRRLIKGKLDVFEQTQHIGPPEFTFEYVMGYGFSKTGHISSNVNFLEEHKNLFLDFLTQ
jgi:hypothetical protein